jgi:putative membrane protein
MHNILAHGGENVVSADSWNTWEFEPFALTLCLASIVLYLRGLTRYWAAQHQGRGIRKWEAACFFVGWVSLFVALFSPLHTVGEKLFFVHMTQHEVLMLLSAPLLVLGKPIIAILHGLPTSWAQALGRMANRNVWRSTWAVLLNPLVAWLLHALAIWIWHVPRLFEATIDSTVVHALQHTCFFGTACIFWWSVIKTGPQPLGLGAAVLYLFTTALHSGLLGALLTFSTRHFYPRYADSAPKLGIAPLNDQQLGGLIMWIPAGMFYVFAALILLTVWMKHSVRASQLEPLSSIPGLH